MNLTILLWCTLAGAGPLDPQGAGGAEATPAVPPVVAQPLARSAPAADAPPDAAHDSLAPSAVLPMGVSVIALFLAIGALMQSSRLAAKVRKLEAQPRGLRPARPELPRDDLSEGTERVRLGEPVRTALLPRRDVVADPVQAPTPSREPPASTPRQEPRPDPSGLNRLGFGRPAAAAAGASVEPERRVESPQPAATSETSAGDAWLRKLSAGRHGTLGSAIGALYLASGELATKYRDVGNQEEFMRIAQVGLKVRMTRFGNAQRAPAGDFHHEWVEPDLIPILDGLSNLYARALAEVRAGNVSAAVVATRLHEVLYHQVAPECQEAGWFTVQVLVPFETEFDPIRHEAIGSAEAPGAKQKILDIRQAGRLDVVSGTVQAPAHVVVGR